MCLHHELNRELNHVLNLSLRLAGRSVLSLQSVLARYIECVLSSIGRGWVDHGGGAAKSVLNVFFLVHKMCSPSTECVLSI